MPLPHTLIFTAFLAASMACLQGCSDRNKTSTTSQDNSTLNQPALVYQPPPLVKPDSQIIIVWQSQQDQLNAAVTAAENLLAAIEALLQNPTNDELEHSRTLWWEALHVIAPSSLTPALSKQIQAPATIKISRTFGYISRWPTHLGYLDESPLHGKTGLIFDIDTPITTEILRLQHGLTSAQDATLGLYPLGAVLQGANGLRTVTDFMPIDQLSESDRVMGFANTIELAANRRRQLVHLQAKLLAEDLKSVASAWAKRDRYSAINALSQATISNQYRKCLQAAQRVVAQQIMELKSAPEQLTGHTAAFAKQVEQLRDKRWHAQLTGIEQWLLLLEESNTLAKISELKGLLIDGLSSPLPTAPTNAGDTITELKQSSLAGSKSNVSSSPSANEKLEALMAAIALELKMAIEKIPEDSLN